MDTGVDDALAIIFALHAAEIDIIGITTVSGNISSKQAALNTQFIINQFAVKEYPPIAVGSNESLTYRRPSSLLGIHGFDGLGGAYMPQSEKRPFEKMDAVDFMLSSAKKYKSQLSIVATGPLTNIARAIQKDRSAMMGVGRIYFMGCAIEREGNINEHAEFNAYFDPAALSIVLKSKIPVIVFPLNITEKVHLRKKTLQSYMEAYLNKGRLLGAITNTYMEYHKRRYGFLGCFMHDTLPVIYLVKPTLFELEDKYLSVDVSSGGSAGKVTVDRAGENRTKVALNVHEEGILELFWEKLDTPLECHYNA
jgi:inosine-uridine nucleoside N-ribohydrolase